MPLLASGHARWTAAEEAHLEGFSLEDAKSLSKEGGGPLPYSTSQIQSKLRTRLGSRPRRYDDDDEEEEDDDDDFGGKKSSVPNVPPPIDPKKVVKEQNAAKRSAGQALFSTLGVSAMKESKQVRPSAPAAPVASPSGYHTPVSREPMPRYDQPTMRAMMSRSVAEVLSDEEDDLAWLQPPPAKRFSPVLPTPVYHRPTSSSWSSIARSDASPSREEEYPEAIEIDTKKRCPWVDLFIHRDWVRIFVCHLPQTTNVIASISGESVFIVLEGWRFPAQEFISEADAARSQRPNRFVFKFDITGLGVDLGSLPTKTGGAAWHCFSFRRF